MSWYDGETACQSVALGGFTDWFMPNNAEVQSIIESYGLWNRTATTTSGNYSSLMLIHGCSSLWTSQASGSYAYYYYLKDVAGSGRSDYEWKWTLSSSTINKSNIKGVFAVRKYRTENQ